MWLFYAISGYVVTLSVLVQHPGGPGFARLGSFLRRRIARIVPLYYAFIVTGLLVAAARGLPQDGASVASLFGFTENMLAIVGRGQINGWPTGHLWTLSVEMQFYAVYGVALCLLPRRMTAALLIGFILLCPVARLATSLWVNDRGWSASDAAYAVYAGPALHFDTFAMGGLLAFSRMGGSIARIARPLCCAGGVALAGYAAAYVAIDHVVRGEQGATMFRNVVSGILIGQYREIFLYSAVGLAVTGLVAMAAAQDRLIAPVLGNRALQRVGEISYGGYLFRVLGVIAANMLLVATGSGGQDDGLGSRLFAFVVCSIVTLALAWASYRWFELPVRRWLVGRDGFFALGRKSGTRGVIDVDFSLAIHNRTGKYFIGRDLLAIEGLPLGDVRYWMLARAAVPTGLFGRVIGRLQLLHIKGHTTGGAFRLLPRTAPRRPLLHLDPFTVPATRLRPCDAVLVHDLGPITHPELFDAGVCAIYRHIYDELARVGPHLVFVSKASMRCFETLYPASRPASIRVIYPALRADLAQGGKQAMAGIESPFLLTVGSIGARKNQARSIAAFERSGLAQRGICYVICGGREPGFDYVAAAAAATPGVIHLPYVSDAELRWLYARASGFVLMSLLEGFGMPVAEAIAHGLVPLLTRGDVLEEVAGAGALLADALDCDEIAARMVALVALSPADRTRRMTMLHDSIERFTLDRFCADWRAAFHEILT